MVKDKAHAVIVHPKTQRVVHKTKQHARPEVGVFLIELHIVSREIPFFYWITVGIVGVYTTTVYLIHRL